MREKRRGERVLIRIAVEVVGVTPDGSEVKLAAETVVVNRFGALLRAPAPLKHGSEFTLTNTFSGQVEKFRVVWAGQKQADHWDIGVEAVNPRDEFWGLSLPPQAAQES